MLKHGVTFLSFRAQIQTLPHGDNDDNGDKYKSGGHAPQNAHDGLKIAGLRFGTWVSPQMTFLLLRKRWERLQLVPEGALYN